MYCRDVNTTRSYEVSALCLAAALQDHIVYHRHWFHTSNRGRISNLESQKASNVHYNSGSSSRPDLEWSGQTRYSDVRRNQSPAKRTISLILVLALAVPLWRHISRSKKLTLSSIGQTWGNLPNFDQTWSIGRSSRTQKWSTCVSRANGTASCRLKSRKTSWPGPVFSQVVHETW